MLLQPPTRIHRRTVQFFGSDSMNSKSKWWKKLFSIKFMSHTRCWRPAWHALCQNRWCFEWTKIDVNNRALFQSRPIDQWRWRSRIGSFGETFCFNEVNEDLCNTIEFCSHTLVWFAPGIPGSYASSGKYSSQPGNGENFGNLASTTGALWLADGLLNKTDNSWPDCLCGNVVLEDPLLPPRARDRQKLLLTFDFDFKYYTHQVNTEITQT